ncbi:uncharacterized protein [Drosophila takahashii]|uniref:uncharacterized protein n=1 Tax=Drosophila takahashii TaxID=29030 RepID=UPI001CF902DB|nr:ubiquitin-conjugating enzyme E2 Z [Drosophila takahashii]
MPARRSERLRNQRISAEAAASTPSDSNSEMSLRRTRNPNAQAAASRGGRGSTRGRNLSGRIANPAPASTAATRGQRGGRRAVRGRNMARILTIRPTNPMGANLESLDLGSTGASDPPANSFIPIFSPPRPSSPAGQNMSLMLRLQRMGTAIPTQGDPLSTARLQKEIAEFAREQTEGCRVQVVDGNLFHWIATIPGPPETPYEGGNFKIEMVFPSNYPFQAPYIAFITRIYHCNIAMSGHICLDILSSQWSPALSVSKLLISIMSLMADPNPNDPLESGIAELYRKNRTQHDDHAREWTRKYAKE